MEIKLILYLLLAHYMADFLFQPKEVFISKGKNMGWLIVHVIAYGGIMFLFMLLGMYLFKLGFPMIMKSLFLSGALHFIIDFISGRILAKYWERSKTPEMFVTAGAEQFIHLSITMLIINWLN